MEDNFEYEEEINIIKDLFPYFSCKYCTCYQEGGEKFFTDERGYCHKHKIYMYEKDFCSNIQIVEDELYN